MAVTAPEWLMKRGGKLQEGPDRRRWYVVFDGRPQYALVALPTDGQFGCAVTQTINGRRVESTGNAASESDALLGGLEALRKDLGW